jgi:hypothetical protein
VTVSGCTKDGRVTQEWIDNAQAFMDEAFRKLKGLKTVKRYGVPAASAETHAKGQRRSWQLISTTLVLRETTPSGPFTVKPVV